ncbi:MAG TPA: hypothetical protein VFI31_22530 [Pirellulales bacterium]|nr:hypothetical protein [Pirellulales bacterium]
MAKRPGLGWRMAGVALPCFALLSANCQLQAQEPRDAESETVRGTVKSMTTAPKGEIDGAVLEDGTVLHWPPHLEKQFGDVVKPGDRVTATGAVRRGREGDERLEVREVTNVATDDTAVNDDRGPRPKRRKGPPAPPRRREEMKTVRGKVERLTTAPKGEIDGAVLEDGTVLHWPPHLEDRFADVVLRGDRVEARGFQETTPKGDEHFEVASVSNLRTDASADNDGLNERMGPRGPRDRDRGRNDDRSRDERIRELKKQVERLQREIERLQDER